MIYNMDTFELIEKLLKKPKEEVMEAFLELMLKGQIDFIDLNKSYVRMLEIIRNDQNNKLFEAESCVLESFHYKKTGKKQDDINHIQRCLYLLNESNRFMMQSFNEKFKYDKDIGKKMSWYERNKRVLK